MEKEKDHIEGFSPEVAWVTKTGDTEIIDECNLLAIRPTSECAIYPILSNVISNHTDLPLKYNQWCSVVRWEFKDATPFIRSREFLWQEGHTCHETEEEALNEVYDILNLYRQTYKDVLAIPTISGRKTDKEKFGGAELTTTIEAYIPIVGKAIQCATSHFLGQKFSKMFNISYNTKEGETNYVWQNSWGFTTRSIGIMLMTHSDDVGAFYTPILAPIQIVIIPIYKNDNYNIIMEHVNKIYNRLKKEYRITIETRNNTGWKHKHWELMGAPIRLEIGIKETEKNCVRLCRRDNKEKLNIVFDDHITLNISNIFDSIHNTMFLKAKENLDQNICRAKTWDSFCTNINKSKLCLSPFCNQTICEENIKNDTGAKSLCIPDIDGEYTYKISDLVCVKCSSRALVCCLFGKSY